LKGVLIGLFLLLGMGGIAAALFLSNRSETPVTPAIAPSVMPASPSVENRETIIREKSTEIVPVPVPTSPPAQPDINITVPSAQPSVTQTQPSTDSEAVSPSPSSSTTEPVPASPSP
jgi:hypothetical protein